MNLIFLKIELKREAFVETENVWKKFDAMGWNGGRSTFQKR